MKAAMNELKPLNGRSRVGMYGRQITCSHCFNTIWVAHFAWKTLLCGKCNRYVPKHRWLTEHPKPQRSNIDKQRVYQMYMRGLLTDYPSGDYINGTGRI